MINFYEQDFVKKHLPKKDDLQKEYTGMEINKHILLCGMTGAGKTNALLNYIYLTTLPPKGTFDAIFLCYKTDEALYKGLAEKINKKNQLQRFFQIKGIEKFPHCDSFPDYDPENPKEYLIIFDDIVSDKMTKHLEKVEKYYSYGRKKGLTCVYLTQSFFDSPRFLRKNFSYLLLLTINNKRELKDILRLYSLNVSEEVLQRMFNYATNERMSLFKLCTIVCEESKRFSKDFTNYLNPKDFENSSQPLAIQDSQQEEEKEEQQEQKKKVVKRTRKKE
jgi:hypothetical protein